MATKPNNVPDGAVCVPPGQTFGPGLGVQTATLVSIQAQVEKQNQGKREVYSQGLKDWTYNAQWAFYAHQPIPPAPARPQIATMHVEYATESGEVVPVPQGADGLHWAWTWETYAELSLAGAS